MAVKRALLSRLMRRDLDAESATPGTREALTFAQGLGHRLRQVREANAETAANVASHAQRLGLGWDRSTVARIELGQRQVSARELLVMALVYEVALQDLLPTEPVRLTDQVTVGAEALKGSLTAPPAGGWHIAGLREEVAAALDALQPRLEALAARLPGAHARTILQAAAHVRDEATTKAARRLNASDEEVAVAAQGLWRRSLAEERDVRVSSMGEASSARARQARRGHVTRTLLVELAPKILAIRGADAPETETGNG